MSKLFLRSIIAAVDALSNDDLRRSDPRPDLDDIPEVIREQIARGETFAVSEEVQKIFHLRSLAHQQELELEAERIVCEPERRDEIADELSDVRRQFKRLDFILDHAVHDEYPEQSEGMDAMIFLPGYRVAFVKKPPIAEMLEDLIGSFDPSIAGLARRMAREDRMAA